MSKSVILVAVGVILGVLVLLSERILAKGVYRELTDCLKVLKSGNFSLKMSASPGNVLSGHK
jgi:hypothetical protein